jgi:hypothetical protein
VNARRFHSLLHRIRSVYVSQWNFLRQALVRESLLNQTRKDLQLTRCRWKGKTLFIVGNGPSLANEQVSLASNNCFIALNRAYQLFDASAFGQGGCGYLMINDFNRNLEILPTLDHRFRQVVIGCHNPEDVFFYPSLLRPGWIFANCAWGLRLTRIGPAFSDLSSLQLFSSDFSKAYYSGWSVLFSALQFAAFLGVSRIVLIGCEMDFSGPIEYSPLIRSDRFNLGHNSCCFDYDIHGRPHMIASVNALEELGIELLNATPGGAIQEVTRVSMSQLNHLLTLK